MKPFLLLFILTTLLIASPDKSEPIHKAFSDYRTALLAQDGKQAWHLVDTHTKEYYHDIAKQAVSMKREDLERTDFLSKFMILLLRMEYRKKELKKMDGEKLFVSAIERGWISASTVQSIESLDSISITQNLAKGFIELSSTIPIMHFITEGAEWKIALWRGFELANRTMNQFAKQSGMSDDEFLETMLSQVSKFKLDPKIYDGPLK